MACGGLHCAGCGAGGSAPVVAFGAVYGFVWVTEHLVEVIVTSAVCGVLAVAAVVCLMRWADRRDERRRAEWRALKAARAPEVVTVTASALPGPERAAPGFRDLHIHLDGQLNPEQAAVIRQALGRLGP